MKLTLVCLLAVAAVGLALPQAHYTDKYDNINIQEIIQNERLLKAYIMCILDKGKCTPEGTELKKHIGDAIETGCSKCTETQSSGTRTVIKHLINHQPGYWNDLKTKYDSKGVYSAKYEKELRTLH